MTSSVLRLGFCLIVRIRLILPFWLMSTAIGLAAPSVFPTGVTRYDPKEAYNCDALFSAPDGRTYLIDMDGHVLHTWAYSGVPPKILDPARTAGRRGEIGLQVKLVAPGSKISGINLIPGQEGPFADETFGYLDWSGKVLWQWGTQAPGGAALQHHDWELLRNGDTLLLANRVGRLQGFGKRLMLDPVIYEVSRAGRIVWSWRASEHLRGLGFTPARLRVMQAEASADYLHVNDMQELGPNRWAAAGDLRFAPGNILISSRNSNVMAIIGRATGKIVWRLGPDFAPVQRPYGKLLDARRVPYVLDRLSGEHDAHMIREGLPGAGDILVFDNEGEGGYPPLSMPIIAGSRVLEINPMTRMVVWQYTGTKSTFFSPFISSAERLPNGNTLIDEGIWGRFFQVTSQGRIVWEYVSPYTGRPPPGVSTPIRWIYRVQAVPYDWVPKGVPHSEVAVHPPTAGQFHVAAGSE